MLSRNGARASWSALALAAFLGGCTSVDRGLATRVRPPVPIGSLRPSDERHALADEQRALDAGVFVVCFRTGDIGNRTRFVRAPQRAAQAVLDRLDARIRNAPTRGPEDLTNADIGVAVTREWPLFGTYPEVGTVCPIVGRARVMHAHRYSKSVIFDAKLVPTADAQAAAAVPGADTISLVFCSPYRPTKRVGYACTLSGSSAGYLSVIGAPFVIYGRGHE
jgi:hypothetical protein